MKKKKVKKAKKKTNKKKDSYEFSKFVADVFADPSFVMGIGAMHVTNDYVVSRFSLEYLKKAVKIAEEMGQDSLDFCVAKDKIIGLGKYDRKKKICSGIVVAPRIES